jgi:hypothetical protein
MRHVLLPSDVEAIFRDRGIEPDEEFTAAAGKDQGYVAAWKLADGDYLIAYGNNAETYYAICDNADDLAHWLEDPDLSGLDAILQKANIRGAVSIDAAAEDAEGPFYVVMTRYYYGGPTEVSEIVEDDEGGPRKFATYDDAFEWVEAEEEGIYHTGHDEIGRPSYVIVAVPD